MKRRNFRSLTNSFFISVFITSFSACSYFGLPNPITGEGPHLDDYSTTTKGAAAGATIGAVGGALIGATSGSVGEGFLIGSLAGGAAGGLIGNEFEEQEGEIQAHKEESIRQQALIQSQERELKEIRKSLNEVFPANKPSLNPDISLDEYGGNPKARGWGEPVSRNAEDSWGKPIVKDYLSSHQPSVSNSRARLSAPSANLEVGLPKPKKPVIKKVPSPEIVAFKVPKPRKATIEKSIIEAKKEVKKASAPKLAPIKVKEPKLDLAKLESKTIQKVEEAEKKIEKKVSNVVAPASKPVIESQASIDVAKLQEIDAKCAQAEEEAERARNATSAADKLFYLRRALRLCTDESSYHFEIGEVYEEIGRIDDAKFEYQQAIEIDPENQQAHRKLASLRN